VCLLHYESSYPCGAGARARFYDSRAVSLAALTTCLRSLGRPQPGILLSARCYSARHFSFMYAITRLRAAKSAWTWQVQFTRRGKVYSKWFYDGRHGGSKKALAAAIRWRDRRIAEQPTLLMREFHCRKRSNNSSGVPGVEFTKPKHQPGGSWQARIKLTDGRKRTKNFSIRKFGEAEAFARAVAAREELLALVDDRPFLRHATAKRLSTSARNRSARRHASVARKSTPAGSSTAKRDKKRPTTNVKEIRDSNRAVKSKLPLSKPGARANIGCHRHS
jgi:AP2 domain